MMQRNSLQSLLIASNMSNTSSILTTSSMPATITAARLHLQKLLALVKDLEESVSRIAAHAGDASSSEWEAELAAVASKRAQTDRLLAAANDEWASHARRLLVRRRARRERVRRVRHEARELRREAERRIDDDLRAARDCLLAAEQEALRAARVEVAVRDTVRRATEGRRCAERLRALATLRAARERSAAGRGQPDHAHNARVFNAHIERLERVWRRRVSDYERAEGRRRADLARPTPDPSVAWTRTMFGDERLPQRTFTTLQDFVRTRCEWDKWVHPAGSSLPLGWLLPPDTYTWHDTTSDTTAS